MLVTLFHCVVRQFSLEFSNPATEENAGALSDTSHCASLRKVGEYDTVLAQLLFEGKFNIELHLYN